jgi:hypothetical protein
LLTEHRYPVSGFLGILAKQEDWFLVSSSHSVVNTLVIVGQLLFLMPSPYLTSGLGLA